MSTQTVESHVFEVRCDVCDNGAGKASVRTHARQMAIDADWSFPTWFNGLDYVMRDLCPDCAPAFLKELAEQGITYRL